MDVTNRSFGTCSVVNILSAYFVLRPYGDCSVCCTIKEKEHINFFLFTRLNPDKPQQLYLDDERGLERSNLNHKLPLVFFIHGFTGSGNEKTPSSWTVKNAFLKTRNCNVILVDWRALSAAIHYGYAVENVPVVGNYTARFLRFLIKNKVPINSVHVIGFSLGAEVAGFVGKQMKKWGIVVPRITGLDPALPEFQVGSPRRTLSYKVANFVDVIHTDGGCFGNPEAMGHVDFYPNGGRALQPGCGGSSLQSRWWPVETVKQCLVKPSNFDKQSPKNFDWLPSAADIKRFLTVACSHNRAWEYFAESIKRPEAFLANKCEPSETIGKCNDNNGRAYMGFGADKKLRGKFFLKANLPSPYIEIGESSILIYVLKKAGQV